MVDAVKGGESVRILKHGCKPRITKLYEMSSTVEEVHQRIADLIQPALDEENDPPREATPPHRLALYYSRTHFQRITGYLDLEATRKAIAARIAEHEKW